MVLKTSILSKSSYLGDRYLIENAKILSDLSSAIVGRFLGSTTKVFIIKSLSLGLYFDEIYRLSIQSCFKC